MKRSSREKQRSLKKTVQLDGVDGCAQISEDPNKGKCLKIKSRWKQPIEPGTLLASQFSVPRITEEQFKRVVAKGPLNALRWGKNKGGWLLKQGTHKSSIYMVNCCDQNETPNVDYHVDADMGLVLIAIRDLKKGDRLILHYDKACKFMFQ